MLKLRYTIICCTCKFFPDKLRCASFMSIAFRDITNANFKLAHRVQRGYISLHKCATTRIVSTDSRVTPANTLTRALCPRKKRRTRCSELQPRRLPLHLRRDGDKSFRQKPCATRRLYLSRFTTYDRASLNSRAAVAGTVCAEICASSLLIVMSRRRNALAPSPPPRTRARGPLPRIKIRESVTSQGCAVTFAACCLTARSKRILFFHLPDR